MPPFLQHKVQVLSTAKLTIWLQLPLLNKQLLLKTIQSMTRNRGQTLKSPVYCQTLLFLNWQLWREEKTGVDSESLKQHFCSKCVTDCRSQELSDIRGPQEKDLSQTEETGSISPVLACRHEACSPDSSDLGKHFCSLALEGALPFLNENPPMKCFQTCRSPAEDPASSPNLSALVSLLARTYSYLQNKSHKYRSIYGLSNKYSQLISQVSCCCFSLIMLFWWVYLGLCCDSIVASWACFALHWCCPIFSVLTLHDPDTV